MSSRRVARGRAIGRLIRPYLDNTSNEHQAGQSSAQAEQIDQIEQDEQDEQDSDEQFDAAGLASELAHEEGMCLSC